LVYADDVNILGDSKDTVKKNTQTLIDASKEIGLEVNTERTKYMSLHVSVTIDHPQVFSFESFHTALVGILIFTKRKCNRMLKYRIEVFICS
jgi:hypothetical protein